MIKANNKIGKERIWINPVTSKIESQPLDTDTDAHVHDERFISVREEPSLHVRVSKKSGWNHGCDPPSQVLLGKSTHIEIRDVVGTFCVSYNGVVQCTKDYTGHVLHARTDRDV